MLYGTSDNNKSTEKEEEVEKELFSSKISQHF